LTDAHHPALEDRGMTIVIGCISADEALHRITTRVRSIPRMTAACDPAAAAATVARHRLAGRSSTAT
jgi:hypothetical protein